MRRQVAVIMLAALLGACGSSERPAAPPAPVSPNGEPLVQGATGAPCEAAIAQWFDAVDRNHDGGLDQVEFLADTRRWFSVMDTNGDGSVTPDELTELRLKLMPPEVRRASTERERLEENRRERRGWFGGGARRGPNDRPDPVMSADVNLDNRVTWEEFETQARRIFAGLDRNRDGRVTKDEAVSGSCTGAR